MNKINVHVIDTAKPMDCSTETFPTIPLVGDTIVLAPDKGKFEVIKRTIFLFENKYSAELWVKPI